MMNNFFMRITRRIDGKIYSYEFRNPYWVDGECGGCGKYRGKDLGTRLMNLMTGPGGPMVCDDCLKKEEEERKEYYRHR